MLLVIHSCRYFFFFFFFFFNDTATTEIYTLSLHDALPIWAAPGGSTPAGRCPTSRPSACARSANASRPARPARPEVSPRPLICLRNVLGRRGGGALRRAQRVGTG